MIDVDMLRPTADEMLSGISATEAMKQRLLFEANAVERLPAVAGEMLGGLTATPALRHRILVAVDRKQRASRPARQETPARHPRLARLTPVVGMALVVTLMIGLGVNYGTPSLTAPGGAQQVAGGLPSYQSGTVVQTGAVPQYRSIFEGEGANPPLIGINGRFYRLVSVPVSRSVVGSAIAEVQEYTEEPSLAASVGVASNIVPVGTQVYNIEGISFKTACIAEVDGIPRLFQRVGYASDTVVGREVLADTLDIAGKVTALELSGVGVITDADVANELIYVLGEFASYHGSDFGSAGQALTIYLDNDLSLQLMVNGDIISGCGAWSCPEFFEAFAAELSA